MVVREDTAQGVRFAYLDYLEVVTGDDGHGVVVAGSQELQRWQREDLRTMLSNEFGPVEVTGWYRDNPAMAKVICPPDVSPRDVFDWLLPRVQLAA